MGLIIRCDQCDELVEGGRTGYSVHYQLQPERDSSPRPEWFSNLCRACKGQLLTELAPQDLAVLEVRPFKTQIPYSERNPYPWADTPGSPTSPRS